MLKIRHRGGVLIGTGFWSFNATWPLAVFEITQAELTISVWFRRPLKLLRSEVTRVTECSGTVSNAVRVEHTSRLVNPFVLLWTFRPKELMSEFRSMGYVRE